MRLIAGDDRHDGWRIAMAGYRGTFVGELTEQQHKIIDAEEKLAGPI